MEQLEETPYKSGPTWRHETIKIRNPIAVLSGHWALSFQLKITAKAATTRKNCRDHRSSEETEKIFTDKTNLSQETLHGWKIANRIHGWSGNIGVTTEHNKD